MSAQVLNGIKNLGWGHISLTNKGFDGAVDVFKAKDGSDVAVCYNAEEAFVVKDSQGLYGLDDLVQGVIKSNDFNIEFTGEIEGAQIIAFLNEGDYHSTDEVLEELGINDFSVKDTLERKLRALNVLTEMKNALE